MSASPPLPPLTSVISRLRAAGCVFAEDEAQLLTCEARTADELACMLERRVAGLPLEHVLGWAEFHGMRVCVTPGVFVPRRRTEFLVQQAATLARPRAIVVDLCCGSGALGAALSATRQGRQEKAGDTVYATDIDPAAVLCARRNLADHGGLVYEGDLYDPLPAALRGRVDLLLANVPYVPTEAIALLPPEARMHEPRAALDGGADGLDVLRRVTAEAQRWLAPGGRLLFETSQRQAPQAVAIVTAAGLTARVATSDELYATVVTGTRPGPEGAGQVDQAGQAGQDARPSG